MSYDVICLKCNASLTGDGTEHLRAAHQLDLTSSTWRDIPWGGHELILADGTPVVRRTPTILSSETVSAFDNWNDAMTALNEARAEANQHIAPWVWQIGPGAHALVVAPDGLCIYGELRHDDRTPADYVFGCWYSVAEPDGELGDNHRSALTLPLPANVFALCKRAGWPHDLEALLALLCNAGAKDWPDRRGDPQLYALKADLVARACRAAGTERFWIAEHAYARAVRWPWMNWLNAWWREHTGEYLFGAEHMMIIFVETRLQLDGDQLQLAFHFHLGDRLPNLPSWPGANGRGWRKQQAQPRALEIAQSYLTARGVLIGGQ